MNKEEFKQRWESDPEDVSFDDLADCAEAWGLFAQPRAENLLQVLYAVLRAAGTKDAENFRV